MVIDKQMNLDIEIYSTTEYRAPTNDNFYLEIRGHKRITDVVDAEKAIYTNDPEALKRVCTQIDDIKMVSKYRQFSSNGFYWVKFLFLI
jgi:hypothetical protein